MNTTTNYTISIIDEYELPEISNNTTPKKIENKVGYLLFNIVNNNSTIHKILKTYSIYLQELHANILNFDNCVSILNNLKTELENNDIDYFVSNLIYSDILNILVANIEDGQYIKKELYKERFNCYFIKRLLLYANEKEIDDYIKGNKYNYDTEQYNNLLNSSIDIKKIELKYEITISQKRIENLTKSINSSYHQKKTIKTIHDYIDALNDRCHIFLLFFSSDYYKQPKKKQNIINKVLTFDIKLPASSTSYVSIKNNILKPLSLNDFSKKNTDILELCSTCTKYYIDTLDDLFNVYVKYWMDNRPKIIACKNCGKLFVSTNKQLYCNNIFRNGKTCQELSGDMKKNDDIIYVLYRSNYKTQFNKMNRNKPNNPNIKEKFNIWNASAKKQMENCKKDLLTYDELKIWFKNNQNWNK